MGPQCPGANNHQLTMALSAESVALYVSQCDRCLKRKSVPQSTPHINVTTTRLLQMICVGFYIFIFFCLRENNNRIRGPFYQIFSGFSYTQSNS